MVGILKGAAGGAVVSVIIKAVDNYSKEFNKIDKQIQNSNNKFEKAFLITKKLTAQYGIAIGAAIGFGTEVVKASIESERAMQAFNKVVGDTSDTLLNELRVASRGMVSDFALMDSANRALALGIDKNKLPELLEIARVRGKITGRTVTEAFEDISIGIGRQSRLILDNLGIILDTNVAYQEFVDEGLAASIEAMTEMEKKAAITNKVIKESENLMIIFSDAAEITGDKLQTLSASIENLKVKVGNLIKPFVDLAVVVGGLGENVDITNEKIMDERIIEALDKQAIGWRDVKNEIQEGADAITAFEKKLRGLTEGPFEDQLLINREIADINLQIAEERQRLLELGEEDSKALRDLEDRKDLLQAEKDVQDARLDVVKSITDQELTLKDAIDRTTISVLENLPKQLNEYQGLLDKQKEITSALDARIEEVKKTVDEEIKEWDRLERKLESVANAISNIRGSTLTKGFSGFGGFGKIFGVGDAIIRPNGDIIKTHPKDTLIATKNPGGMGGGMTIIIEGNNIYGTDPDDIANALQKQLNLQLTAGN